MSILFPRTYKPYGFVLFLASSFIGALDFYFEIKMPLLNDFSDEVACIGIILGLIIIGFSKEKVEDEMIQSFRLSSLLWSLFINYTLLILAIVLLYDVRFLQALIYNMFTLLVVYNIRFHWLLKKNHI